MCSHGRRGSAPLCSCGAAAPPKDAERPQREETPDLGAEGPSGCTPAGCWCCGAVVLAVLLGSALAAALFGR